MDSQATPADESEWSPILSEAVTSRGNLTGAVYLALGILIVLANVLFHHDLQFVIDRAMLRNMGFPLAAGVAFFWILIILSVARTSSTRFFLVALILLSLCQIFLAVALPKDPRLVAVADTASVLSIAGITLAFWAGRLLLKQATGSPNGQGKGKQ